MNVRILVPVLLSCLSVVLGESEEGCSLDLVLLADNSGSVTRSNHELRNMKKFLHDIVAEFPIGTGPLQTQIGLISFANKAVIRAELGDDAATLNAAIQGISESNEYTNTLQAMKLALDLLKRPEKDRTDDLHPDVVILITDGRPTVLEDGSTIHDNATDPTTTLSRENVKEAIIKTASQLRKEHGAKIMAVGIGPDVNDTFIENVVDKQFDKPLYHKVEDFQKLVSILNDLKKDACAPVYTECAIDLALAVDMSGSVGPAYRNVSKFLHEIVKDLYMNETDMHISLISFQTDAKVRLPLDNYNDTKFTNAINELRPGGWTATASMLKIVDERVFNGTGGDLSNRTNVMIVVTDGLPSVALNGQLVSDHDLANKPPLYDEVEEKCHKLANNISILPVIVKGRFHYNYDVLRKMATNNLEPVEVDRFDQLIDQVNKIKLEACNATIETTTPPSTTHNPGKRTRNEQYLLKHLKAKRFHH